MKRITYIRHLFGEKKNCFFYLFILLFAGGSLLRPLDPGKPAYDTIYQSLFSPPPMTFLLYPLFLLLVMHNSTIFDHPYVVPKMRKRKAWWEKRIQYLGLDIGMFLLFTNGLAVVLPLIMGKTDPHLPVAKILLNMVLQFLGYYFLAVLFLTVRVWSGKATFGFLASYAVVAADYICLQTAYDINLLMLHIFILTTGRVWLSNFLYLFFLCAASTIGGYYIIRDIDIL